MRPRVRSRAVPPSVTGVHAYRPATRMKRQVQDLRKGKRGLVAHWFKLEFVPRDLGKGTPSALGSRRFASMRNHLSGMGASLTNGPIVRVGHIPRVRGKKGIPTIQVPYSPGKFFTYMGTVLSGKVKKGLRQRPSFRDSESVNQYERFHRQATFNMGLNCILEVGNDGQGNPTHILVMKRPSSVPIEPDVHDFPAGLLRKTGTMAELISGVNGRIEKEVGVKASALRVIGPGLKPVQEPILFALQRLDRLANYNPVVIQRANVGVEEVRRKVQAHIDDRRNARDPFAAAGFVLVPRDARSVREFAQKHSTFMPEVFRLYAQELNKNRKRD